MAHQAPTEILRPQPGVPRHTWEYWLPGTTYTRMDSNCFLINTDAIYLVCTY